MEQLRPAAPNTSGTTGAGPAGKPTLRGTAQSAQIGLDSAGIMTQTQRARPGAAQLTKVSWQKMQIASHVDIDAKPEVVWRKLTDFQSFSSWNPFIVKAGGNIQRDGQLAITVRSSDDKESSFTPRVQVADPGRALAWKGTVGHSSIFAGTHAFTLADNGRGGTTLHHTEQFSGLLIPMMRKTIAKFVPQFDEMNDALKRRVEGSKV